MMTTVKDIYDFLCAAAPLELQMSFDNSGFLVGRSDREVKRALLSLDVTADVIDEAIEQRAELIISHHPVIFSAIKKLTDDKLLRLIEKSIAVISMHTNLDIADGGVNDVLLSLLGAECDEALDGDGCGRIGELPSAMNFDDFLNICKSRLNSKGLRYYSAGKPVKRLAVMGGAGGDFAALAFEKNCDTYVTADIKYNRFLEAAEMGLNLIDADHFCTENPVMPVLKKRLCAAFPNVEFNLSAVHGQIISFI